jgi:hypothetical protein
MPQHDQPQGLGLGINQLSVPEIKIMSTPPTPTSTRSRRFVNHDTGFPEPFNGMRNTTLPHPDADMSPNACISQDDLNVEMAMKRRRHSFLRKHRRTTSHGYVLPSTEPSTLSSMSSSMPPPPPLVTTAIREVQADEARFVASPLEASPRVSKEDSHSGGSARYDAELTPPTTPDDSKPQRRRSLLYRWRRK